MSCFPDSLKVRSGPGGSGFRCQRVDDRGRSTEERKQKSEDRRLRAEVSGQKSEGRGQKVRSSEGGKVRQNPQFDHVIPFTFSL